MKTLITSILVLIAGAACAKLKVSAYGGIGSQSQITVAGHSLLSSSTKPSLTGIYGGSIKASIKKWDIGVFAEARNLKYSNIYTTVFVGKPICIIGLTVDRHISIAYAGLNAGYVINKNRSSYNGKVLNIQAGSGYMVEAHIGISPQLMKNIAVFVQMSGAYNNIDRHITDINAQPIRQHGYFFSYGINAGITLVI